MIFDMTYSQLERKINKKMEEPEYDPKDVAFTWEVKDCTFNDNSVGSYSFIPCSNNLVFTSGHGCQSASNNDIHITGNLIVDGTITVNDSNNGITCFTYGTLNQCK